MLSKINSMALQGLDGYLIDVQVDVSNGMPCFEMVGLPDTSVKEAKERVKTAIKNSGYELLSKRIVVNLAPADTKKEGSIFDLPIAIGILQDIGEISNKDLSKIAFIGELSLDGKINRVNGILPMCIEARKLGIEELIVPSANANEAAIVEEMKVIGVKNLRQVVGYLNGEINLNTSKVDLEELFNSENKYTLDFSEVKGQENIKRALEIAAAGRTQCATYSEVRAHGKTMMARRIPSILPDLSFEEALEITKIHSVAGELPKSIPIITTRPFRSPHHTVSGTSLVGGGRIPRPGEISLAHFGVLFLDELPEFNKNTLEVMRGPLEDGVVTISRVNATLTYPCNFMFVASMNPCPCGYYGSKDKECNCTPQMISKYMGKVSGPLLDRIDIQVEVTPVKYNKLDGEEVAESSKEIKKRVDMARKIQQQRYAKEKIYSNSQLTPKLIEKYCKLDEESRNILKLSFEKLGLSARAHGRILKVARTIADLANEENIKKEHIAEAIQYRNLDKKYWKN